MSVTVTSAENARVLRRGCLEWRDVAPIHESPAVPSDEVLAQLERILAADLFANAGRLSRLLRYVVERTLAGEGPLLKEYVLGTEVFDRGDTYDPRLDSIVRVEARRLRAKLDEYYRGPGAADPVIIVIPRGGYVPLFAHAAPAPELPPAPAEPAPLAGSGGTQAWWRVGRRPAVAVLVSALAAVLLAAAVSRRAAPPTAEAARGPSIAVLPFAHYSADAGDAMAAARLTDRVITELARLGSVSVVSRTTVSRYTNDGRPAREVAAALGADFLMESTLTADGGRLRVAARLVSGQTDLKVWVGEYHAAKSEIDEVSRRIAAESAAAAMKYDLEH